MPVVSNVMTELLQIHVDIELRVQAIRSEHRDWLCRMGCDGCCRRLAQIPRLAAAEWELLCAGLAELPPEDLHEIGRNVAALALQSSRPLVCPMLDQAQGACRVYAHRPVACRTYGFYVERDLGLYCKDIEARVVDGALAGMVWGNQASIERGLDELGDRRDLTEWFELWQVAKCTTSSNEA